MNRRNSNSGSDDEDDGDSSLGVVRFQVPGLVDLPIESDVRTRPRSACRLAAPRWRASCTTSSSFPRRPRSMRSTATAHRRSLVSSLRSPSRRLARRCRRSRDAVARRAQVGAAPPHHKHHRSRAHSDSDAAALRAAEHQVCRHVERTELAAQTAAAVGRHRVGRAGGRRADDQV
jgi:hypothetical protein